MGTGAEQVATWLLGAAGIYLALGAIFAIAFASRGARRIDPRAEDGSWGFRLAILPGVAALWPILARRWLAGTPPPEEGNAHRNRAARDRGAEGAP